MKKAMEFHFKSVKKFKCKIIILTTGCRRQTGFSIIFAEKNVYSLLIRGEQETTKENTSISPYEIIRKNESRNITELSSRRGRKLI